MKKILLILATLATPAYAQSGPLICAIKHQSGDDVRYMFDVDADGDLVEQAFMKNGKFTGHPPDDQPVWVARTSSGNKVTLTYLRDPRFSLVIDDSYSRRDGRIIKSPAQLRRDGRVVGEGACGYEKV